ncbi:hypothetical protein [Metabacillus niabensis]|uniref:hypothetical protein n=1 Tax=Metabacillus niabensis TaxID=324854 RepID=UPI001CF964F3|nr:hypothetical protein [Metabacillus niabensis]
MKVNIIEHSGEVHVTEVASFDPLETFNQLKEAQNNESSDHVVLIGSVIIDSRSVKSVAPATE